MGNCKFINSISYHRFFICSWIIFNTLYVCRIFKFHLLVNICSPYSFIIFCISAKLVVMSACLFLISVIWLFSLFWQKVVSSTDLFKEIPVSLIFFFDFVHVIFPIPIFSYFLPLLIVNLVCFSFSSGLDGSSESPLFKKQNRTCV
jgi:hypothetical protein